MVSHPYVPDAGDLVWLTFDPQVGRERRGRRPALILSPKAYNRRTQLALACPITSRAKGYPFEAALPVGSPVAGVVLTDHLKSLDWHERRAEYAGPADDDVLANVRALLSSLLGL